MSSFLMTTIWFLIAISILVAIHEYGHFIVARLCGVKVLRFSIGFCPRLLKFTGKQGTEFAISAVPLGGYVKMLDEREMDVDEDEKHLSYNSKRVEKRIAIAAAGPLANVLLAFVLYWAIFLNGTTALSPEIGMVKPGSLAAQAGLAQGQEIVSVDGVATHSRRDVALALINRLGESGDIAITTKYPNEAGDQYQYNSVVRIDSWLRGTEEPDPLSELGIEFFTPASHTEVLAVGPESRAEAAGFIKGDRFLVIDGQIVTTGEDWVSVVEANPDTVLDVLVDRNGVELALRLKPEPVTVGGKIIGRAGVSIARDPYPSSMVRRQEYSILEASIEGAVETYETIGFVFLSLKKLVVGEISIKNLSGPIGIAKVAADQAQYGFWAFISFLAHVSVVLAVLNMLPVPVLDGGHILFCVVEWVKGSPLSERVQLLGFKAGMALLLSVMVVAFYNDILRL